MQPWAEVHPQPPHGMPQASPCLVAPTVPPRSAEEDGRAKEAAGDDAITPPPPVVLLLLTRHSSSFSSSTMACLRPPLVLLLLDRRRPPLRRPLLVLRLLAHRSSFSIATHTKMTPLPPSTPVPLLASAILTISPPVPHPSPMLPPPPAASTVTCSSSTARPSPSLTHLKQEIQNVSENSLFDCCVICASATAVPRQPCPSIPGRTRSVTADDERQRFSRARSSFDLGNGLRLENKN
jgi:hypothetical protein